MSNTENPIHAPATVNTHYYCACGWEGLVINDGDLSWFRCPKCRTGVTNAKSQAAWGTPSYFDVANAMIELGGSFVRALGQALLKADNINQGRIKLAFPEYWHEYEDWARKGVGRKEEDVH